MHISDPGEKAWIQERIEGRDKEIAFTREGKRAILNKLVEAEGFEKFCTRTPAPSASASTAAKR
jgi:2-oxoglutarate dehydrogenase E1 component